MRSEVLQLTRKKTGEVVGLDIEAGSVAAAEVRVNGDAHVGAAAIEPLPAGAFSEGEVADPEMLADALKGFFARNKLSKRVRLGIGNQRVVVRAIRLPVIEDHKEMEAAVRFQAQEQIPMPLDQAVLEHQVVGGVPAEEGAAAQVDVIVVAARREMVSSFLGPIRQAGLDPVGVDLAAFGMIRALAGQNPVAESGGAGEAVLYCNVGDVMNLAVARGRACLFTRVSNAGLDGIAARLGAETGLNREDAIKWLAHVGLEQPLEAIGGEPEIVAATRRALEDGLGGLVDELRLSLDYYGAQDGAVPVRTLVLCGPGSAVPGLVGQMEEQLGLPAVASSPAALADRGESAAARLTLPFGLALES
jgi:type IV pilus assembly protein PilM